MQATSYLFWLNGVLVNSVFGGELLQKVKLQLQAEGAEVEF